MRLIFLRFVFAALAAPCALVMFQGSAAAQMLGGIVVDTTTGAAIPDAIISVLDERGIVRGRIASDSAGVFRFPLSAPGRYRLQAEHPQYALHSTRLIAVRRGEQIAVELRLGLQVTELAPLVVTARTRHAVSYLTRFYDRMDRQKKIGLGRFITREDIDRTATANVHTLLQREPSIRLMRVSAAGMGISEWLVLSHRGGMGISPFCSPMLYLNGMLIGRSSRVELSWFVSPDQIEGIEIYRSGLEAPGEMADACGAIGVWTRLVTDGDSNPFTWKRLAMAGGFVVLALLLVK